MLKHALLPIVFASIFVAPPQVAVAYDGLQADFATCTRGDSKTQAKAMVTACGRLIANAKAENETVGMFYALRASVNTDKQRNCLDARKAVALIKTPGLRANAQQLEKAQCAPAPRSDKGGAPGATAHAQLA